MNHDYAHCLDFTEDCPEECFRAQLSRDLKPNDIVSFMHLKDTEECRMPKNAKVCYFCGKPIKEGIQYLLFRRDIKNWDWPYYIGDKAGNPAFCEKCNKRFLDILNKNKYKKE